LEVIYGSNQRQHFMQQLQFKPEEQLQFKPEAPARHASIAAKKLRTGKSSRGGGKGAKGTEPPLKLQQLPQ
jgi:hypothetical protein